MKKKIKIKATLIDRAEVTKAAFKLAKKTH